MVYNKAVFMREKGGRTIMIKLVFDSVPDSLPDAHRALQQQEKSDRKKTGRQMTRPKRTGG